MWDLRVGSLDVYYLREHGKNPMVVSTVEEVDALIDRVRAESPPAAPILMYVHLSGEPAAQGLDVGISSDCGIIRYAGREWPEGVLSTGENPDDHTERPYCYMDNWTGLPAGAEVSLDVIRQAVKEFLATDGARPTCVRWQPNPLWQDLLDD
jgi:hypothetical protein